MTTLRAELASRLDELRERDRERFLSAPCGVDFCSNDYLGLSSDPEFLERVRHKATHGPLTAPSSRLLRGQLALHEETETRLAAFKGADAALIFPSGYQANLGLLTALIGREDRAISDAANHACLIDGLRLARCERVIVPHLDVSAIETELARPHQRGRTFLVTESLFSMDGDVAPLDTYARLCARHGAELIVDDAHASGLFGARGSGLIEQFGVDDQVAAAVTTFGKAFGASGACVTGSRELCDWLINTCRPFVFSTAAPPFMLHAVDVALEMIHESPERRQRVLTRAGELRAQLAGHGIEIQSGAGPIIPVLLGTDARASGVAERVQADGYDVRAIRPPTVPEGTARLRISVHADRTPEEIAGVADAIARAVQTVPA